MKLFKKNNDRGFYVFCFIIITFLLIIVLYPCIYVVSASFSSGAAVNSGKVVLWPVDFSLDGYRLVFANSNVWTGFKNSIIYTVGGIIALVVPTFSCAYVFSRRDLPGKNFFLFIFTFTMFFGGGMIPTYLLVKSLGLVDTRMYMVMPAVAVYDMIMARTFIQSNIPEELFDSARMDGCSDIKYLIKVVVPLSKAIIAVLVLFFGVGQWNSFMGPKIYLRRNELMPLTVVLNRILMSTQVSNDAIKSSELAMKMVDLAGTMKYALIVVTMTPIMMIYPFVQKYFVKGIMIGAIKG